MTDGCRAGEEADPPTPSAELETLRALRSATEAITSTKRLDDLFDAVGEHVSRIVSYHSLRLFLYDEQTRELYPAAIATTREDYREVDLSMPQLRMKLGQGVTGMVAATRTGEVVYDLSTHPHVYYPPGVAAVDEESYIGVPLVFRDELVGALTLSKYGRAVFDEHQLGVLEVLAVPIAAAVAHARAEDAEQRAREQEARLRRLHGSFVGNISHELRTPLTTALGFLELAIDRHGDSELLPDLLERSREGIERLRDLIEKLLEAVAIEAGQQELRLGEHRAGDLIDRAAARSEVPAARLTVTGDLDAVIVVDGVRIAHVISELLENALKYGPRRGMISVTAHDASESFQLDVRDEGGGIPGELAEAIFDRFVQGESGLTRRHGGAGIGLSLARSIARWHGGELSAVPGSPTRFHLSLPQLPKGDARDLDGAGGGGTAEP